MYDWIRDIVSVAAFIAFTELLFPKGTLGKSVRLTYSLFFLFTILNQPIHWILAR